MKKKEKKTKINIDGDRGGKKMGTEAKIMAALARKERESRIAVFPGSIAEYESWRNYAVDIIDTQRNDKGIRLTVTEQGEGYLLAPDSTIDLLVENGVEAIVNAVRTSHYRKTQAEQDYYGLPVRRKKESK